MPRKERQSISKRSRSSKKRCCCFYYCMHVVVHVYTHYADIFFLIINICIYCIHLCNIKAFTPLFSHLYTTQNNTLPNKTEKLTMNLLLLLLLLKAQVAILHLLRVYTCIQHRRTATQIYVAYDGKENAPDAQAHVQIWASHKAQFLGASLFLQFVALLYVHNKNYMQAMPFKSSIFSILFFFFFCAIFHWTLNLFDYIVFFSLCTTQRNRWICVPTTTKADLRWSSWLKCRRKEWGRFFFVFQRKLKRRIDNNNHKFTHTKTKSKTRRRKRRKFSGIWWFL